MWRATVQVQDENVATGAHLAGDVGLEEQRLDDADILVAQLLLH